VPHYKRIRFEVEDTGIGISPEHLQEIFMPFHQIGEQQFHGQGTGLGLSISSRIVQLMGGELHVESTPGTGSRFWFDLELKESQMDVTSIPEQFPVLKGFTGKQFVDEDRWQESMSQGSMLRSDLSALQSSLAQIPADLVAQLEQISIQGAPDEMESLLVKIRGYHADLADALAVLAAEFEYGKILEWIEGSRNR
jgi:hypothetical protein